MSSDEALYAAWIEGDLRAFDSLYERYEKPLFGFIRQYLGNPHEAEDVLHETFLAVLRDRAGARAARSLRAWLFQVARNLCLNRKRSQRRAAGALEREVPLPVEDSNPLERAVEQRQIQAALQHAVAGLPIELGELYRMRSQGLSYDEMADALAIPLGTVKSRMHQLVSQLREEMNR